MHPEFFSLGPLHIRMYGLMMALGFFAAWQVAAWLCRRTGRNAERLTNLVVLLMVAGVVGSRIAYVVEHWQAEFAGNLLEIIRIDHGGLMFYGGLILAVVVFLAYCRITRAKILELGDLLVVVIPLGHAFGRIGCFLNGCCYGKLTTGCCGVVFPKFSPAWYEQVDAKLIPTSATGSLPVIPTQLVEFAGTFLLFLILFFLYRKVWNRRPGLVIGVYLAGYGCLRFLLEFLRGDPRAAVGPFSIGQTISIGLWILAAGFIAHAFVKGPAANGPKE